MFRSQSQRGMLTVFFSCGSKPLALWDTHIKNGYIQKLVDPEIKSTVFDIGGVNVSTTYMICPKGRKVLGIAMPFLVMVVKNLKKYFSFEVTILDDTGTRRRFRASNFQSTTSIQFLSTVMPIGLSDGWNQIQFNLAEFTKRAYQKQYIETQNLKVNANIRIRRIYFTDKLLPEDQLPPEYKIFFPLASRVKPKKAIESKISESFVTEGSKGSKETVRTESRASVRSKKASQQTVEQLSPSASAECAICPPYCCDAPAEVLTKVPSEEIQPETQEEQEDIGAGDDKITEVEQKEIIEAGGEEAVAEEEEVPAPEKTEEEEEGKDVVGSVERLESIPESEFTPVEEAKAEEDVAPETVFSASPGSEASQET